MRLPLSGLGWLTAGLVVAACSGGKQSSAGGGAGAAPSGGVVELMKARGLSEADVTAALKTYTPTGKFDEYLTFASGGHSGQVLVIGVPSMRILKYIAVFTPEPWQGYGFDDQTKNLLASDSHGRNLSWADTHHPALSEQGGDYDGKFLFIGDKANARVAVIDLADFTTKQIVSSKLIGSDHGAAFVTPNTDYVIETTQYPTPFGGGFADPKTDYKAKYRGAAVFWKFDRAKGRIDKDASFAVEFPPYTQDLADAGKLASDGYAFFNSINTELSWGGNMEGNPPMESGSSQNDMDYLHVVNWRKAEELVKAGKFEVIGDMKVLRLDVAAAEGVLTFVPEPKSPHGVDVTPDGKDIAVGGKLDTHGTVYSFEKIKAQIDAKQYAGKDDYGVPILDFKASIRGQVELGLGPLHTVYDGQGYAYTSMFLETVVAKWSLADLKVVDKVSTHYNIGHLTAAEGDTVSPDGKYLIAMNKWALDRFNKVGPLLPQNFQLVDLTTPKMTVLYDMPIGLGEPHYAQMIKADKLTPVDVYKPGEDAVTSQLSPNATEGGKERVERRPDGVHVYMTAIRSHFTPDVVRVKEGETVHVHLTNLEQAYDATHGFAINSYNVNVSIEPGEASDITFVADRAGVFPMYCTEFCSALHLEMAGYLLVEPK
ncbi:MAG: Sec-dependent nitrous-oxide reductase [Myxococcales bacterium]|nr:Sec-dependent nitrous-oxide reductase [Myxococcales bacterium]MBK7194043.1 Sec-dependent nitrous-oxide reductase [Myxococcales bacterium]MBP6846069.1 Sec-dependent nitrous-oxide reductase [Kofleriaceae bacterium]